MKSVAGIVFLLAPMAGCGAHSCNLQAELSELAGSGAKDCGHVSLNASAASVDACVVDSFRKHAAFFAQYDRRGTDSKVVFGLVGNVSGEVTFLDWDGDPSGGSGEDPVITENRCKSPSVDTSSARDASTTPAIACRSTVSLGRTCE
jgi:hypothetical protein